MVAKKIVLICFLVWLNPLSADGSSDLEATRDTIDRIIAQSRHDQAAVDALSQMVSHERLTLLQELNRSQGRRQLLLAWSLMTQNEEPVAVDALSHSIKQSDAADPFARQALHLLYLYGGQSGATALQSLWTDKQLPEPWRDLAASLAVRRGDQAEAATWLEEELAQASPARQEDLIFALGQAGVMTKVRTTLELWSLEPSDRGERARQILNTHRLENWSGGLDTEQSLKYRSLYQEAEGLLNEVLRDPQQLGSRRFLQSFLYRAQSILQRQRVLEEKFDERFLKAQQSLLLIWEILGEIQDYHDDEELADVDRLLTAAAQGMMSALDVHSAYHDRRDQKIQNERLEGNYEGIGAVVIKNQRGFIEIESVFFGSPAHERGIRSGDEIVSVEGESIADMSLEEAVGYLRGPRGTQVNFEVWRNGWSKPVDFELTRRRVELPSLFAEVLPGDLGYIRLTEFISNTDEKLDETLTAMENQGIKGLILDFRDNGGGLLDTAINVCECFLERGEMIVYSEGRNPWIAPRQETRSTGKLTHPALPTVILINGGSASASEVVTGAMRDHGRAKVVGQRSFGKGSVQTLRPLDATKGETSLRLTIAHYYLPSGESIHRGADGEGGIKPDIEVEDDLLSAIEVEELLRLQRDQVFENYVADRFTEHQALFEELAQADAYDTGRYPGFSAFFSSLDTKLSEDLIRRFLRQEIRRKVNLASGHYYRADLQADKALKRGIIEVMAMRGESLEGHPHYGSYLESFPLKERGDQQEVAER